MSTQERRIVSIRFATINGDTALNLATYTQITNIGTPLYIVSIGPSSVHAYRLQIKHTTSAKLVHDTISIVGSAVPCRVRLPTDGLLTVTANGVVAECCMSIEIGPPYAAGM